jgi:hypothetical protein
MRLTKLDMARVVVQGLYMLDELPAPEHWHVRKLVRRKYAALQPAYDMAVDAINARIREEV